MTYPAGVPVQKLAFLKGGGKVSTIIADFDWSATSLGAMQTWPQSVKSTVGLILQSPVPIVTLWHEKGYMIYNDAYAVFAGARHPQVLGMAVHDAWPEIREFVANVMQTVFAGGTLSYQDQHLTLHRNGVPESVWLNLDYSPVLDEAGTPVAVIAIVVETTSKVQAERRLLNERERLQILFEQAPGFMAMLSGPDHVFELANAAYLQLVGARPLLGRAARDAIPEAEGQGFFELLDQVLETGTAFTGTALPMRLLPTTGVQRSQRYVDVVFQPILEPEGQVRGIFIQGSDVTERIAAEKAARESEARFHTWAQAMPNHVWTAPPNGRLDWFNRQVYAYSGKQEGELDGPGWLTIVHPDDLYSAREKWLTALVGGQGYETEFRLRRADGTYRWHLGRALPILEKGEIVRWIGTNTDIEDQKTAAAALAALNSTLAHQIALRTAERDRMWRLSTDLMLVADFSSKIVAINPAWTQLLGWSEAEVLDLPFLSLVHPDDLAATKAQIASLSIGATTFRFENRYRSKQGHYLTMSWTAVPDAQFLHAVGRDITAEREAARALAQTEQALQQAQKMEALGNLTGGVAHDFNNLLQVISGNLQLLGWDIQHNQRAQDRVKKAMDSVTRGAKLASYLLAFGRRQALDPRVVELSQLISNMEDMLHRSLGDAIELKTIISGELWNTLVDTSQVENAILNLAINARDAMDGVGKLTLEVGNALLNDDYVRAHPEVAPGQYVLLAVSDTGSGMTPEVLAQAFEPFFSTKSEDKGTGLGLSMVYGFIKQSGGHVKLYSEPGHGTTVKLYLPLSQEREENWISTPLPQVVGGSETILVAEDDAEVRVVVVDMLKALGYQVLQASDASSALKIIQQGAAVDLLFSDVIMPGPLRSPELARLGREYLPKLIVLYTSGYTENAIVHGGKLDRSVALLEKPYTHETLAQKIRQVLSSPPVSA